MRLSKRMALAISGLGLAGAALTLGSAVPASAQTVSGAPQRAAVAPTWDGCFGDFFFDDFFFDDCFC